MVETRDIKQLKHLFSRQKKATKKLNDINNEIDTILNGIDIKREVKKENHPKAGSVPSALCKVMSSLPMSKEDIAKETGLKVGTVAFYLHRYKCFQFAGRKKGYKYIKPKGKKI